MISHELNCLHCYKNDRNVSKKSPAACHEAGSSVRGITAFICQLCSPQALACDCQLGAVKSPRVTDLFFRLNFQANTIIRWLWVYILLISCTSHDQKKQDEKTCTNSCEGQATCFLGWFGETRDAGELGNYLVQRYLAISAILRPQGLDTQNQGSLQDVWKVLFTGGGKKYQCPKVVCNTLLTLNYLAFRPLIIVINLPDFICTSATHAPRSALLCINNCCLQIALFWNWHRDSFLQAVC